MMEWEFARSPCVFVRDIERPDGPRTQRQRNELRRRVRKRQRAERELDGDFPGAYCGEIQLRRRPRQDLFRTGIESVISIKAPEEYARIQQELHAFFLDFLERFFFRPSNRSSKSSGKGASKSSGTFSCPRRIPRTRGDFSCGTGTRRATGTPRLAMVISSPAATRRSSRDSCVFASCVFTFSMSSY